MARVSKTTGPKPQAAPRRRPAGSVPASPIVISPEAIAVEAYSLFLERGGQNGDALNDWLTAEQRLRERHLQERKTNKPRPAVRPRRRTGSMAADGSS